MVTFNIVKQNENRIGIFFTGDDMQSTIFLTAKEFMLLMSKMFYYRDEHKEEIQKQLVIS